MALEVVVVADEIRCRGRCRGWNRRSTTSRRALHRCHQAEIDQEVDKALRLAAELLVSGDTAVFVRCAVGDLLAGIHLQPRYPVASQ